MNLFSRRSEARARIEPSFAPEVRNTPYSGGWEALSAMSAAGGAGAVSPALAENLSAVTGAVELIAGTFASLPATLTVDTPDGTDAAPDTATGWALLQRPNPRQSWHAWASWAAAQWLLQGNALSHLQTDGRGAVTALVPVPWHWVNVSLVAGADGPRVAYDLMADTAETRALGLPRRMLDSDVLHVRARSDAGIVGRSVLSRAGGVFREGMLLATAAEATWRNGMRPSGFFSLPGNFNQVHWDRLDASLDRYRNAINAGKVPIMFGGMEFKPLAMNSADAEFLSTRRFTVEEIARMFNIPTPMLQAGQNAPGDLSPYVAAFAQLALAPVVTAFEQEFGHAILPPGYRLQLDMGGLLRGNYSAAMAALCAAVQSGVMMPNDARRVLGLPAHEDGDALRVGAAPNWPADAPGMPHLGPSPGKTGDGVPAPGTHQNNGAA